MSLRVVFMGTPGFARGVLERLTTSTHQVVGVVTVADKPAGRGQKLSTSAVKDFAVEQNLPLLQPTNLKDEAFTEALRSWNADVFVVVAFRMLPKSVWSMPKYGTFNLHASLLPQYRGAAPINWAIINQETKTGVTTFFIDDKIDTGAMILHRTSEIDERETFESLHDKLLTVGSELVVETLDGIFQGTIEPKVQLERETLREAPKLNKDNTKIDWTKNCTEVDALIRGLSPYPTAWSLFKEDETATTTKIFLATPKPELNSIPMGKIEVIGKELLVGCGSGALKIEELQLAGKKRVRAIDFINGLNRQKTQEFTS